MIEVLLEAGALMNPRFGISALAVAIGASKFDTAKLLLTKGADPNGYGIERYCCSPLESAIRAKNADMIDVLLTRGADVNKRSAAHGGRTPLQCAAEQG